MVICVPVIERSENKIGKKLLEGKSGDAGFVHDSPDQITRCLNCPLAACIDCYDMKYGESESEDPGIDYKRPLLPNEVLVLSYYAKCENDKEISDAIGMPRHKVYLYRKQLGLPAANMLEEHDRQLFVDRWLRS